MTSKQKWTIVALVIVLCATIYVLNEYYVGAIKALNTDIASITSRYEDAIAQARVMETSRDILRASYDKLEYDLKSVRMQNDNRAKEAGNNAYTKKINLSDAELADAWGSYMSGVRQRNSERR